MTAVDFIDVSEHQGAIDWAAVPVPAIVKATEGSTFVDHRLDFNAHGAQVAGKLAGVYHFLTSTSRGVDQAEHFVRTVNARIGSNLPAPFVWVLDWETDTTGTRPEVLTARNFVQRFRELMPTATLWLYANAWAKPFADEFGAGFWCAAYPAPRNEQAMELVMRSYNAVAWQWSSAGSVDGIAGRVDVNKFLATPPAMEGQPMTITDDDLLRIRAFCGLDPVPSRDYADDGSFTETAPLPVVQLAANAHIEAQLASLAADRANATVNTLAVVVAQLRQEWDDLHLTTVPAVSHDALVAAVKQALRELFTA